jgi:hypothetical protein
MTPDQKAALSRLRRVTDGEDPLVVYRITDEYSSSMASQQCAMDEGIVAAMYLSDHPADDDEPVTVEWLNASHATPLGCLFGQSMFDIVNNGVGVRLAVSDDSCEAAVYSGTGLPMCMEIKTRRQLRSLLSALNPESE